MPMLTRMTFFSPPLAAVLAAALIGLPGAGAADIVTPRDAVEARLLPGWRQADGTHMAALSLQLAPGWKTYWRAPGDAGIPPRFDWDGSENLDRVDPHWPRPEIFVVSGMRSIGYSDEVVLPLRITPHAGADPITISARMEIGVCEDICMPVDFSVRAVLPAGGAPDPRITAALATEPETAAAAGVGRVTCRLAPAGDGMELTARMAVPSLGAGTPAVVFELPDPDVWIGEADVRREDGALTATAEIIDYGGALMLDRSALRITLLGSEKAVDIRGCDGG